MAVSGWADPASANNNSSTALAWRESSEKFAPSAVSVAPSGRAVPALVPTVPLSIDLARSHFLRVHFRRKRSGRRA